jgi:hypothetical protein
MFKRPVYKLFVLCMMAIFFASFLMDSFDQDDPFPIKIVRLKSDTLGNYGSLDKKKRFYANENTGSLNQLKVCDEVVSTDSHPFNSLSPHFLYFLRAPPAA